MQLYDPHQFQTEKDFAQAVVDLAHLHNWTVWRTWSSRHSPAGEPDLRMVRPPRVLFAELKVKKNQPTRDQVVALELLRQCPGVETYLFYPPDWDRIEAILR